MHLIEACVCLHDNVVTVADNLPAFCLVVTYRLEKISHELARQGQGQFAEVQGHSVRL